MSEMMGGNEDEAGKKMKRVAFIFDSMTTEELDSDGSLFRDPEASTSKNPAPSENGKEKAVNPEDDMKPREPNKRVLRVARGSGTSVNEVEEVLMQHQMFAGMVKKAGGKSGWCVLLVLPLFAELTLLFSQDEQDEGWRSGRTTRRDGRYATDGRRRNAQHGRSAGESLLGPGCHRSWLTF